MTCTTGTGAHEPIVAATESDMDGALTMQLFKHLTGKPVLFADVRHYEKSIGAWYFGNSGTAATYYAGKSEDAKKLKARVAVSGDERLSGRGRERAPLCGGGWGDAGASGKEGGKYCLTICAGRDRAI